MPPPHTQIDIYAHATDNHNQQLLQSRPTTVAQCVRPKHFPEWQDDSMLVFSNWPPESWAHVAKNSPTQVSTSERHQDGPPPDGLALLPGDNVFTPHSGAQWTQNWGWCLHWPLASNSLSEIGSEWVIIMTMSSKSDPCRRTYGDVSISDANTSPVRGLVKQYGQGKLPTRFPFCQTWAFTSLEAVPQADRDWMAEVRLYHTDHSRLDTFDWRGVLTARNTASFKIDQKITRNEYKNVVMMQTGHWYGNDLTGQEVESWADDMPERLARFASSIMTLG